MFQDYKIHNGPLHLISNYKALITTLNAHCYNIAQTDPLYQEALIKSDILIPDGISIVGATLLLTGQKLKKIAGEDLMESLRSSSSMSTVRVWWTE